MAILAGPALIASNVTVLAKTDWAALRKDAGDGGRMCHALSPLFPLSNILLALLVVIGDSSIKRLTGPFGFLKPWAVRGLYQIFVALHAESACIEADAQTQVVHFVAVVALAAVGGLYFISGLLCLKRVKQAIDGTGGSDAAPLSGKDSLRGKNRNQNKYLKAEDDGQVTVEVDPPAKKSRRGMC